MRLTGSLIILMFEEEETLLRNWSYWLGNILFLYESPKLRRRLDLNVIVAVNQWRILGLQEKAMVVMRKKNRERNKRMDWRVLELESGMVEENIGLLQRDEEVRCYSIDLLAECEVRNDGQHETIEANDVCGPNERGPRGRANTTEVIELGGRIRKVRQISEILVSVEPQDLSR
ncbi:hypothetical protein V6N11_050964 [Hibiscus sabdariffa]|uniref:DUF4283 domain-containing protein n=1 Tax=Hibiscus sabdariffa TaxID=183260 RepID=A0ABR2R302_9ROSI